MLVSGVQHKDPDSQIRFLFGFFSFRCYYKIFSIVPCAVRDFKFEFQTLVLTVEPRKEENAQNGLQS